MATACRVSSQIMAGVTGPVTLAGALAQLNAEVLSGITILQLASPGNPVLYGCVSSAMEPRGGTFVYGASELGLLCAAAAQMAKFYGIPSRGSGGTTDSCTMDIQAGSEGAITALLPTLAGVNLILYSVGGLESALTASYEKAIYDNEVLGMVIRAARGIRVSDETLALDVMDAVGPGGHYLSTKHTRQHYGEEQFTPKLLSKLRYDSWKEAGSKEIREVAKEKAKKILKDHQPEPLDKDVEKELEKIVREVEKRAAKGGSPS